MEVFDIDKISALPYEHREKNLFYQAKEFETRIVELPPGGEMPICEMASYVIFYVLRSEVNITVDSETIYLKEKQCLISEPAAISMKTEGGVKLTGIQVITSNQGLNNN